MPQPTGRRADPLLLALIGLGVLLVPWFLVGPGGRVLPWVVQVALDVLLALLGWRLAASTPDRHARRFWRTLVVTCLSCAVGDAYQTATVLAHPAGTGTSVAQTGFVVGGMSLIVVAMLSHPLGGSGRQRLRLWLDSATVLAAIAVFLWYFSLAGAIVSTDDAARWVAAVTSAVMLLIGFGVIKLLLSGTAPFSLVPGVVGSIGVSGTAVSASLPAGVHPDVATLVSLIPCVISAVALRMQELHNRRPDADRRVEGRRRASRLPYLAVLATQALLVAGLVAGADRLRMWGVAGGTLLITGLVLSRQAAAFRDNERLLDQLEGLHDELRHQATHDALTGLANRAYLEERLRSLPGGATLSILLIDLDGFKPVNDRHGHAAGDEVLVAVAGRLAALVGPGRVVGRLGGDEFAVLLTDAEPGDLPERIAASLSSPIALADGVTVAVGASVGIATGPAATAARLLRDADAAMYRVKATRKAVRRVA